MSHEIDLAGRLRAAEIQFAEVQQNLHMGISASRHLRPMQFRQEQSFFPEMNTNANPQLEFSPAFAALKNDQQNERRLREIAMYNYIANRTNFLSENPEERERQSRLLKHYIELYAHNPNTYPIDPQNKTHCIVHEAGWAVLRAERERHLLAKEQTPKHGHRHSDSQSHGHVHDNGLEHRHSHGHGQILSQEEKNSPPKAPLAFLKQNKKK